MDFYCKNCGKDLNNGEVFLKEGKHVFKDKESWLTANFCSIGCLFEYYGIKLAKVKLGRLSLDESVDSEKRAALVFDMIKKEEAENELLNNIHFSCECVDEDNPANWSENDK